MQDIFFAMGKVFFAFLMSSLFEIIRNKGPIHMKRSEKFLFMTCSGFSVAGLLGLIIWIRELTRLALPSQSTSADQMIYIASSIEWFIQSIWPLLFSVSIYILYRHFSRLVTFETEVI